jgi:hypothetical protein
VHLRSRRPPAELSIVAVAIALAAIATPLESIAAQGLPGWSFTTNTTVDSGTAGRTYSMATRERVTDRFLRTEFVQISGMPTAGAAEGTYMLYDTADSTVTMVMAAARMATVMSIPTLPKMEMPHISSISHDASSHEDLGPGEKILGHATHRYRSTTHGSMNIEMGGEICTRATDAVTETWVAPDVDLRPAYDAVMKQFAHSGFGALMEGADSASSHDTVSPEDRGTPMRTVMRRSYTDSAGTVHTVTTTTEYVEISHAPIDATAFAVPSDFHTTDMRKAMAQMQNNPKSAAMFDSLMASHKGDTRRALCR